MSLTGIWGNNSKFFFIVFDEAALTDDLLVELVEVLKRHKQSTNKNKETETAKEKEKETSEGKMCAVL